MADIALDAEALRRDRQRYQRLLDQVDQQIAAWNERAEHLRTTIGGLDQLLALAGGDGPAQVAPVRRGGRSPAAGSGAEAADAADAAETAERGKTAPARRARPKGQGTGAGGAPPPQATPAAPEPVEPPASSAADAPRGTDALRLVLEGDPQRAWALPDLLEALGTRGWLPTSRRPEEGIRISLKRLVERGGAERTDDGRWRLAGAAASAEPEPEEEPWPEAEPPLAPDAPAAEAAPASTAEEPQRPPAPAPPPPRPPARPASFGRPVGGTVTEL